MCVFLFFEFLKKVFQMWIGILFNYILEKSLYYPLRPGLNSWLKMKTKFWILYHDFSADHHLKPKLRKLFSIIQVFVFTGEIPEQVSWGIMIMC